MLGLVGRVVTRDDGERSDPSDADEPVDKARLDELDVTGLTRELHAHLDATGSRPIDPTANRWLGEATAVAADVADGSAPEAAIRKRASQVLDLLDEVGELEDSEAAEHVIAARRIARELVDRLDEG